MELCAICAGENVPYPSCIGESQGRFETGTGAKVQAARSGAVSMMF